MSFFTDDMKVSQYVLRKWRVAMQQMVSRQLAEDARCDVLEDLMYDALLVRLSTYVLTDQVVSDTYTCHLSVPASWWQHFKQDCMPKARHRWVPQWLWRRYTASRLTMVEKKHLSQDVRFERYATYPRAAVALPPELGDAVIVERVTPRGWKEAA